MEVQLKNTQHHGTGSYWDKRMVSVEINDIIKECQEYMKRGNK